MAGHDAGASAATENPLAHVERELRLTLRRAAAGSAELARRIHPELDASAYPLLSVIQDEPGVHATELARRFGIGRATISRQLSKLEELGLIHRAVDPEDSRGQLLTITDLGSQRITVARERRLQYLGEVFAGWDDGDVEQLASLLSRYTASADAWKARSA